ncbi:MAG: hypothetical protein AAGE94_14430 [Acidobacteriota bacterium]
MSQKAIARADQRVADKRRAVEDRLSDLRQSIDREVRFMPKGQGATLPLVGFACGLAIARRLFGDRR